MLKTALLAAAVALAASAATATDTATDSAAEAVSAAAAGGPCHPDQALEPACALRAADVDAAPAGLASPAAPEAAPFWTPPRPDGELAFKDAATDSVSVLPASVDHDRSRRLAPALLALGALVILLRRRPN